MVVNDIAWVVFWALFFHRVGAIRGWDTERVLLLLAVLTTAGGFVLGLLANARRHRRAWPPAASSTPRWPCRCTRWRTSCVRRINTTNLGDVAFGIVLFVVAGDPTLERTAVFLVGVVASAALLTGFLVTTGSLSFFAGRDDAGELGFHAMLMFAAYPVDVFGGAAKLFLSTVLPAAFVATVPARLIDDFDPVLAVAMLAMAAVFVTPAGRHLHGRACKRYTSGAVWTAA